MIDQKAREIEQAASFMPYSGRRGIGYEAARLGIIEGRRQAFEEAAKVADEHYMKRGNPDYLPACREIAAAIRALIEESKG